MAVETTKPGWTTHELLDAQRRKRRLQTTTPGMAGTIKEVREDSSIVLALEGFQGTAYLNLASLATPPPSVHKPGDRVSTPFGRGQVKEYRSALERVDLVVDLLDCRLANGECAVAYLAADSVKRRSTDDRTFQEMVDDAATFRNRGNDSFKAKSFDEALVEYRKVLDVFSYLPRNLTNEQRAAVRDGVVKALSNAAQCYLTKVPAEYEMARQQCTHALEIDPGNVTGQREKLMYRRGLAFAGLGEWDAAAVDLADPSLAGNGPALAKLAQVKDSARKEKEKNKKMWSAAFNKAAAQPESASDPAVTPPVDGAGSGAGATPASATASPARAGVRFAATPDRVGTASKPSTPATADVADGKRTAKAGHTPFPTRRDKATEDDEDEDEEAGSGVPAPGSEGTLEQEQEEEEEAGGWLTNPITLGVGAVAIGGLAYLGFKMMQRK